MRRLKFADTDPDLHGIGFIYTDDPLPDGFLVAVDAAIQELGIEGHPRPYLSESRLKENGRESHYTNTWTIDVYEDEHFRHFLEWHDTEAILFESTSRRDFLSAPIVWRSERYRP